MDEAREREEILIPADDAAVDRCGHETYMLKEINEQPEAVSETITRNCGPDPLGVQRCPRSARAATATSRASGG